MKLTKAEKLDYFVCSITGAITSAPDEYLQDFQNWPRQKGQLIEEWNEVKRALKKSTEQVAVVDQLLTSMILAFDENRKEDGRNIAWQIYNMKVERFR
jgi:hypothetical protein